MKNMKKHREFTFVNCVTEILFQRFSPFVWPLLMLTIVREQFVDASWLVC